MKKLTLVTDTLDRTNWKALSQQKRALLEAMRALGENERTERLEGLLNWIDALQDAASRDGYPVVWLGVNKR